MKVIIEIKEELGALRDCHDSEKQEILDSIREVFSGETWDDIIRTGLGSRFGITGERKSAPLHDSDGVKIGRIKVFV